VRRKSILTPRGSLYYEIYLPTAACAETTSSCATAFCFGEIPPPSGVYLTFGIQHQASGIGHEAPSHLALPPRKSSKPGYPMSLMSAGALFRDSTTGCTCMLVPAIHLPASRRPRGPPRHVAYLGRCLTLHEENLSWISKGPYWSTRNGSVPPLWFLTFVFLSTDGSSLPLSVFSLRDIYYLTKRQCSEGASARC